MILVILNRKTCHIFYAIHYDFDYFVHTLLHFKFVFVYCKAKFFEPITYNNNNNHILKITNSKLSNNRNEVFSESQLYMWIYNIFKFNDHLFDNDNTKCTNFIADMKLVELINFRILFCHVCKID